MMQENKQETELKSSKSEFQNVINSHIREEHGLNDLFFKPAIYFHPIGRLQPGLRVLKLLMFIRFSQIKENILPSCQGTFPVMI